MSKLYPIKNTCKGKALYKCDCGNTFETWKSNVERGSVYSCGCVNRRAQKKLSKLLDNSLESFYWIGFLFADGHFTDLGRIVLTLSSTDEGHLHNFNKFLGSPGVVRVSEGNVTFAVNDVETVSKVMSEYGLCQNKTYNAPRLLKLSGGQRTAFLIGFIDGDGSIQYHTDRKKVVAQEDHDAWLIDLWNSRVSKTDTVWHLGDFAFNKRKAEQFLAITDKLNGNKKFIRGNHDDKDVLRKSGFEWYDLKGGQLTDRTHIVMCHYPLAIWDKNHRGSYMLHGHSHGGYNPNYGRILDVGLDSAYNLYGEHKFFDEEMIHEFMSTREFKALDHHRQKEQP